MSEELFHTSVQKIKTGVYGEDVRDAIVTAIEQCYEDGKAGAYDPVARKQIDDILKTNGSAFSETTLIEKEIFFSGDNFTIAKTFEQASADSGSTSINIRNFDMICVYYKLVRTAAAEMRMFKTSDFISGQPIVVSTVFIHDGGNSDARTLSARRIQLTCTEGTTHYACEVTYANQISITRNATDNTKFTGSTVGSETGSTSYLPGVITKITGLKWKPVDVAQAYVDRVTALEEEMANASHIQASQPSSDKVRLTDDTDIYEVPTYSAFNQAIGNASHVSVSQPNQGMVVITDGSARYSVADHDEVYNYIDNEMISISQTSQDEVVLTKGNSNFHVYDAQEAYNRLSRIDQTIEELEARIAALEGN